MFVFETESILSLPTFIRVRGSIRNNGIAQVADAGVLNDCTATFGERQKRCLARQNLWSELFPSLVKRRTQRQKNALFAQAKTSIIGN
jgi:hypothetical protein